MPEKTIEVLLSPKFGDVRGFASIGMAVGLKRSGKPDLGIIFSERACSAAGVFTTSRMAAAPVDHDRAGLKKNSSGIRAVVVNSGHANAATGAAGRALARLMSETAERSLQVPPRSVLVCSTGIIGELPNIVILRRGIELAARRLTAADRDFQKAILTTDKVEKVAGVKVRLAAGRSASIVGVAKGSGMIAPNMATMLAFIVTDAAVPPAALRGMLRAAAAGTFNAVTVDGDTSTNDTVLALANGMSGVGISARARPIFFEGLRQVCERLAWKLAEDGEGATKVVEVLVRGARTARSAARAAKTVAESLLVKTAMHGEDPNVGRVLAALGRSGLKEVQADRIDVSFNGLRAVSRGVLDRTHPAPALKNALRPKQVRIEIDLHAGPGAGRSVTCDLSAEYVRINAEYHT